MTFVIMTQFSQFEFLEKNINRKEPSPSPAVKILQDEWGPFVRLTVTAIGRSIIFYGLNTFIPVYWINVLHESKAAGAAALTIFAGSGILGNLLGGPLADRFGQKKIVLIGLSGLTLFLPMFVWVHDLHIATLLLIPIGIALYATYSPTIVLGQDYLPNRIGLSSGVTLGIAVAVGGGAAPIIGRIADLYGIWFAFALVACLPVFTSSVAWTLPDPKGMDEKIGHKESLADGAG